MRAEVTGKESHAGQADDPDDTVNAVWYRGSRFVNDPATELFFRS
jgi:hypothetical protein